MIAGRGPRQRGRRTSCSASPASSRRNDELRDALDRPAPPGGPPPADRRGPARRQGHRTPPSRSSRWSSATAGSASCPAIVDRLLELTAASGDRHVAEVRSAVALTDDQKARLAASLKAATGKDVDIVVIVDPSVLGGIVTQIGDTVIDGSVRHRLAQLRESF